jgi:transaldolase
MYTITTPLATNAKFNLAATIANGRRLVGLYAEWIPVDRLHKIASTWAGVKACEHLQREGVSTNMSLLFDFSRVFIPSI